MLLVVLLLVLVVVAGAHNFRHGPAWSLYEPSTPTLRAIRPSTSSTTIKAGSPLKNCCVPWGWQEQLQQVPVEVHVQAASSMRLPTVQVKSGVTGVLSPYRVHMSRQDVDRGNINLVAESRAASCMTVTLHSICVYAV